MAASDLLPVFSMSQPWAFESAMRHTIRQRAWVFSAASPVSAPPQARASTASKASKGSQMGTVMLEMPRAKASASASSMDDSLE